MSIGEFAYYNTFGAPAGSFGNWVFSAVPDPGSLWTACYSVLSDLGAKTNANGSLLVVCMLTRDFFVTCSSRR
jgi:hypothetical protein